MLVVTARRWLSAAAALLDLDVAVDRVPGHDDGRQAGFGGLGGLVVDVRGVGAGRPDPGGPAGREDQPDPPRVAGRLDGDLAVGTGRPGEVDRDDARPGFGDDPPRHGPLAGLPDIGRGGLEDKSLGFGHRLMPRNEIRLDRQIRYQGPELPVGARAVGLAEPVVQFIEVDPAFGDGDPELLGDGLPVGVRCPDRVRRAYGIGGLLRTCHEMTIWAVAATGRVAVLPVSLRVRLRGRGEAVERRAQDAGPDLAAAFSGQTAVDDRLDARTGDLEDVDPDRRAAEAEVRDEEVRVFGDGDVIHPRVHRDHLGGRVALVSLQPERGRLGEAAEPDGLGDVALAADPLNVIVGEPVEELARDLGSGPRNHSSPRPLTRI